jgi:ABC-type polysaccharide/polyol phosphate transport system ATPase subunit
MNAARVRVRHLSKRFLVLKQQRTTFRVLRALVRRQPLKRELWALRDLSFEVAEGEKLALVGKNGSGKTTLLRVLTGIYERSAGDLQVAGEPKALFKFWIGQNADLSVVDNIYLFGAVHGMGRDFLKPRLEEILDDAGIQETRFSPLRDLSLGQRQRLALAVFFQTPADFMIFDESLAYVDQSFARRCESFFRSVADSPRTIVIASHDHAFLRRHCRRAIWLDEGRIRGDGPAAEVIDAYASWIDDDVTRSQVPESA